MQEDNTEIRKYVRHVTGIPISIRVEQNHTYQSNEDIATNISLGGLSFIASDRLENAQNVEVSFPIFGQALILNGKVMWCAKTNRGYEVGLEFEDPKEIERLKLIEQTSQIERYREEVEQQEGRKLTLLQATREWASQYAGDFTALS